MLPWMLGHAPLLAMFFLLDIILPFLLAGVIGGWVYRALTSQGYNFYDGILHEYGVQSGVLLVLGLMVLSSVLSMAIRQMRHLAEKPTDFFRLPIFILVSTAFLMPIRLIGFFRMGHASGWGTRAGAYGGGASNDQLVREFDTVPLAGVDEPRESWSVDSVTDMDRLFGEAQSEADQNTAVLVDTRPRAAHAPVAVPQPAARRRLNPKAAWPYVIGIAIFALEALFIV
jgi:hyaluronan synthase